MSAIERLKEAVKAAPLYDVMTVMKELREVEEALPTGMSAHRQPGVLAIWSAIGPALGEMRDGLAKAASQQAEDNEKLSILEKALQADDSAREHFVLGED